jgi:hypothetical protein
MLPPLTFARGLLWSMRSVYEGLLSMGVRGNPLVHALPSNVGHLLGNVTLVAWLHRLIFVHFV